jgi:hypothetical protein
LVTTFEIFTGQSFSVEPKKMNVVLTSCYHYDWLFGFEVKRRTFQFPKSNYLTLLRHLKAFTEVGRFLPKDDLVTVEEPEEIFIVPNIPYDEIAQRLVIDHF